MEEMELEFRNLNSQSGLRKLDEHLLTRSYISGYYQLNYKISSLSLSSVSLCRVRVNAGFFPPRMISLSMLPFLRGIHQTS